MSNTFIGRRLIRRAPALTIAALVVGVSLVGCAADAGPGAGSGASVSAASLATEGCGSLPGALPADPDGVLAGLSDDVLRGFHGAEVELKASAWADVAENEGPWKIGYSALPITGSINQAYLDQFEKRFDEAKKQGLVEGKFEVNLMPDPTSMSPAQQLQGYQSLVSRGVDAIILQPFSPAGMTSAVDEAGAAGIVTGALSPVNSAYAVNSMVTFYQDAGSAAAATLGQLKDGKGKVLVVHGFEGIDPEIQGFNGVTAALGECPDVEVVGEISAAFTNATAKTAVQNFLASYPGEIDAVVQMGGMATGIINAFEQVGRPIPLVAGNGISAGALAYWSQNADSYSPAGVAGSPEQQADAVWDVLIRTLAGKGAKTNVMALPPTLITSDNVDDFTVDGADTTSDASMAQGAPYSTPEILDEFFAKAGTPLK
jgi:ribose transport system substrate-binding protein